MSEETAQTETPTSREDKDAAQQQGATTAQQEDNGSADTSNSAGGQQAPAAADKDEDKDKDADDGHHPRGKSARKVPFQYSNFYPPPPMNSKCQSIVAVLPRVCSRAR